MADYCKSNSKHILPRYRPRKYSRILKAYGVSQVVMHLYKSSLVSSETSQYQQKWISIYTIFLDTLTLAHAKQFWLHIEEGMPSRRAEYCRSNFDSYRMCHNAEWSEAIAFSSATPDNERAVAKNKIREYIAVLISNPATIVATSDVFLYEAGTKPIPETYRALLLAFETRYDKFS
jgi:hypothetical protein